MDLRAASILHVTHPSPDFHEMPHRLGLQRQLKDPVSHNAPRQTTNIYARPFALLVPRSIKQPSKNVSIPPRSSRGATLATSMPNQHPLYFSRGAPQQLTLIRSHNNDSAILDIDLIPRICLTNTSVVVLAIDIDFVQVCGRLAGGNKTTGGRGTNRASSTCPSRAKRTWESPLARTPRSWRILRGWAQSSYLDPVPRA